MNFKHAALRTNPSTYIHSHISHRSHDILHARHSCGVRRQERTKSEWCLVFGVCLDLAAPASAESRGMFGSCRLAIPGPAKREARRIGFAFYCETPIMRWRGNTTYNEAVGWGSGACIFWLPNLARFIKVSCIAELHRHRDVASHWPFF
jgi:hypothetical protein